MSQRKAGTVLSYVYFVVSNGISLIYTPYMLRMMGQGEYGLYGTANSFVSYFIGSQLWNWRRIYTI